MNNARGVAEKNLNSANHKIQKKFILVGHVTESYGAVQALSEYLKNMNAFFVLISHPFSCSELLNSSCLLFENKTLIKELRFPSYKTPQFIRFFQDFFFTLYFFLRLGDKYDVFFGFDCLNAFSGIMLRKFRLVKKFVFYECDYTPERFRSKILDFVYHWLNGFAARHADMVWNNPPNMEEIRERQGSSKEKNIRVPHGVDLASVSLPRKIYREVLVYAGHVTEPHGLQLLVKSMPKIVSECPNVKVWIIGSGPYERTLRESIEHENLSSYFKFYGYTNHCLTYQLLSMCGVGLAPYVNEDKGTFRFCEPLKVKDYLACGLPIIITKVPACAYEIEEKRLGIAINYDPDEFSAAALKLLTDDEFYYACKNNVLSISANLTWKHIYDQAFEKSDLEAKLC